MIRKLLKFIGWTLVVLIAIPIIALLVVWIANRSKLGGTDEAHIAYLRDHAHVLIDQGTQKPYTDVLNDAGDVQLFLLGEQHGIADVQLVDAALLKHLNRTYGVRHYVAELDSIRARQLNTYLAAPVKDDALLKEVVLAIANSIPQQSSRELMDKWSDLHDFNHTLPDSLRLHVIGVDVVAEAPGDIDREEALFRNFQEAVRREGLVGAKFHGLFGYYHVLQGDVAGGSKPFAAQLKEAGWNVRSIVCHALDSEVRMPKNDQFPTPPDEKLTMLNSDGPIMIAEGIKDLQEVSTPQSVTLFDLDANGSPYRNDQRLLRLYVNAMGQDLFPAGTAPTTSYFQHVLLLRDAQALTAVP